METPGTHYAPMTLTRLPRHLGLPRDVFTKACALGALTDSLRRALPPALAGRCWAAGHDGSTLEIVVENGAWATEIRYLQREILKRINEEHALALKRAHIRATPARGSPPPLRGTLPSLPESAAATLTAAATSVTDPGLATALEKLAGRVRRR